MGGEDAKGEWDAGGQIWTMVTSTGWVVRVREEDMRRVYSKVVDEGLGDENGKIWYEELGKVLERVLREERPVGEDTDYDAADM